MVNELVEKWLKIKGWSSPNATQAKAVEAGLLKEKRNSVVIAPTASGKTGIAELAILQMIESKQRSVYLVPSKSLVTEKERDLKKFLATEGVAVAGANDTIKEWNSATVVVTTFELFYRTALVQPDIVKNFSLAIIDEFHILYDKLRGFNLEKVLTIMKELNIRIICLSATFEDRKEIGEWLNAGVVEVPESARPVLINHDIINLSGKTNQNAALCAILKDKSQGPYIVFCTTKEAAKLRACEMCKFLLEDSTRKINIAKHFEQILEREQLTELEQELLSCVSKRVAFHHSELHDKLKAYIEQLFLNREIDYLFATTGLAYGINFPAKTVVLSDLSFYDPTSPSLRSDVPVYMYIQMAGRAGRPGFEKEGYSYVVTKTAIEEQYKAPLYINGKIEKAVSQIGNDEYFRKAILELIYSKRSTDKAILGFFENTFYNYQSKKVENPFLPFKIFEIIKNHITYLYNNGVITPLGAPGYKLTDFGEVVVSFLFWTFSTYELEPFIELKKFLDKEGKVRPDFSLLYRISTLFDGVCVSKHPKKTSAKVEKFYANQGITDVRGPEYSAFAVFFGWMENFDELEIENEYKVYSTHLDRACGELYKILRIYESLARKLGYDVDPEFKTFVERVRYGVTEEELPFVKLKHIGRTSVRSLRKYCYGVLKGPSWKYKGSLLEVLKQFYKDVGDKKFLEVHVKYVEGIGPVKGKTILEFIKAQP
jgi:helicase